MKRTLLIGILLCTIWFGIAATFAQEQKKYALLIGINKYSSPDLIKNELKYARADAESLEKLLRERNWDTTALVDASADRQRIIQELYRLSVLAQPSDKVLIYFAGHGVRDPRGSGKTYWVTTESTVSSLISDGIRLNHILEYVDEIGAQEKLLFLDHCYAGDFHVTTNGTDISSRNVLGPASVSANRDLFPAEVENLEAFQDSRLAIFAAARGPAYEDESFGGHGMFTKALLDVLDSPASDNDPKDGKISLEELWSHLRTSLRTMAEQKSLEQKPVSNASVNHLEWKMFSAKVNDFDEEANELTALLAQAEFRAETTLDFQIKAGYENAISEMQVSTNKNLEPDTETLKLIRALRAVRELGVDENSLEILARKYNEASSS